MIKEAAILKDGIIYTGRRHHNIMWDNPKGMFKGEDAIQGFVTDDGKFVDRIEGAKIALESGQIKQLNWPPNLYSEDLY
jgi:hypothetical protein